MRRLSSCTRGWGAPFGKLERAGFADCYRYSVYRRIVDYYNNGSDAFDMRKPLKRDKQRKTVRPNGENIRVQPDEVW